MDNPSNTGAAPAFADPFKEPIASPEPAAGAAPNGGESTPTPEPEPEWMSEAPEEFKAISSHANLKDEQKKWLRDTYGELHTFKSSPYGTPEVMQELVEAFPGGIEDVRTAVQALQESQRVQRMLESGDPDQMNEALEERLVGNADSFIAQLHGGLDALKRSNLTAEYQDIASVLAKDVLESATDGGFATFFDGLNQLSEQYRSLAESNPEQAQKIAGRLAASALELAGWWGRSKNKIGFGEKPPGERPSIRGPVTTRQNPSNQREVQAAQRDVESFNSRRTQENYNAIGPIFRKALSSEITARKITLTEYWKGRVGYDVAQELSRRLEMDPQYMALVNREHYKGNRDDLRGYDTSDKTLRALVAAAKTRAEKLVPKLVSEAIGHIAELNPTAARVTPDPAANVRGGGTPSGNQNKRSAQDILKDKKVGVSESLDALFAN